MSARRTSHSRRPFALRLALVATAAACGWAVAGCASRRPANLVVDPVVLRGNAMLAPRYQAQFEALAAALEAREDEVARRIAETLRLRIDAELRAGDDPGARDASGLLDGLERIVHGRLLVASLELELVVREAEGPLVELALRARTRRATELVLHAAAASLRVHHVTFSPTDGGKQGVSVRTQGVGSLDALALSRDGWLEVSLGTFPTLLPGNALAARTRWSLQFRASEIEEEGERYPANDVPEVSAERVDLAPFLPTTAVDPAELASYAARPDGSLLALFERTVRLDPDRREEALDLLTPLVARMTPEELERLVPTLRWLAGVGQPGREPELWRTWLTQRTAGAAPGADGREGDVLDWGVDR